MGARAMDHLSKFTCRDLVKVQGTPLILNVDSPKIPLQSWVEQNQADVARLLRQNGALLVRGLKFLGSAQLASVLSALFGEPLLPYTYRSTPRTHLRGGVYTATEYHASEAIPQHNENSYANEWPSWIGFLCVTPPGTGGRTPIADSRVVYERIPERIRSRFESKKVLYTRTYGAIDLPWTEVFQTDRKEEVEGYCTNRGIRFRWLDGGGLQTSHVGCATATHPTTKERVWFNQAHLFHVSNLKAEHRARLVDPLNGDAPRNAYHGDGSPLDEEDLECVRRLYDETALSFSWEKEDLLLLDNMLFSHGREPYQGVRKILCGMAGACREEGATARA
jgi:hypothetical protein